MTTLAYPTVSLFSPYVVLPLAFWTLLVIVSLVPWGKKSWEQSVPVLMTVKMMLGVVGLLALSIQVVLTAEGLDATWVNHDQSVTGVATFGPELMLVRLDARDA